MSPLREQILATAKEFTKAHNDCDIEAIRAVLAPDFIGHFNQTSLPAHTLGDKTKDEYIKWQKETYPLFATYNCKLVDVVVDEAHLKAVLYMDIEGTTTVPGITDKYVSKYIHKITVTEDGKLVKGFDSFVDSASMVGFMEKIAAAVGK
ncbi:hypothetical protein QBC38DRAFT_547730 [Podospora fimiseda]|uniref:SnoaL-like domain-containing protein n=1 Tax=Podospora fimiseda TaxID=252190 RepID=A0AAN7GSP2_9PEZI|nr:hypothetical protein QBC38DRAFT_547730 [Podospora fimiseda]